MQESWSVFLSGNSYKLPVGLNSLNAHQRIPTIKDFNTNIQNAIKGVDCQKTWTLITPAVYNFFSMSNISTICFKTCLMDLSYSSDDKGCLVQVE